jgi:hypothetical protein
LWLSLVGGGLAIFAAAGWSFAFDVGPLHVSLRHALNPALVAVAAAAFSAWWLGPAWFEGFNERANQLLLRRAALVALALGAGVGLAAWSHGAFIAGGADSSGYLTETRLWLAGSLRVRPPNLEPVRFEHGNQVLAPLGLRPAAGTDYLVPTYPPGLPLLMAGFELAAGSAAKFWVVPLSAAVLVWTVFALGRRVAGPAVGLLSAAGTAASPTLLFQAVQPMSDVPASCGWILAATILTFPSLGAAGAAAAAATAACLIRPNLFAMVPILAIAALWWAPSWRRGLGRAAILCTVLAAAAIGFAWWQRDLYGALSETGYGGVTYLFSLAHVWPNLSTYPQWLYQSHGWFLLLAAGGPFLVTRAGVGSAAAVGVRAPWIAWWMVLMFGSLFAFYALYFPFDNWTFTRFLLPALPLLIVLAAVTGVAAVGWLPAAFRTLAFAWTVVLVVSLGASKARDLGAFGLWESERRFLEVAEYAAAQPASAVFLSMQHAGSVAYYSGRTVLRWDWLEQTELDRVVEQLAASGRRVYAALEDWEIAELRKRLIGSAAIAALDTPVFRARDREAIDAFVFLVRAEAVPTGN